MIYIGGQKHDTSCNVKDGSLRPDQTLEGVVPESHQWYATLGCCLLIISVYLAGSWTPLWKVVAGSVSLFVLVLLGFGCPWLRSVYCFQELIQADPWYFDFHNVDILPQTKQVSVHLWWAASVTHLGSLQGLSSTLPIFYFIYLFIYLFKFPWGVSYSWSGSQGCRSPSHQPLHGRQECTLTPSLWEEICYLMIRFCNQSNFLEWTGNKVISQSRRNTTLLNLTDIFPPERWCKISGQTGKTTEYTQTKILQMLKADHRSTLDIRSKFYSHRQESPRWETKLDGSKRWHCQCKKHLDWGSDSQRWRNEVPEDIEERKKMENKYWDQNQLEHRRR